MKRPERTLAFAVTALSAALAAAALVVAFQPLSLGMALAAYLVSHSIFFLDFLDFLLRIAIRRRRAPAGAAGVDGWPSAPLAVGPWTRTQQRLHLKPYALCVSVYNAEHELDDFLDAFADLHDRLWVIDDASTDRTRERLLDAGLRCVAGGVNRKKPGAIRHLLGELPPEIETVIVLDPDGAVRGGREQLESVLFEFQRSGMAALCPRLAVREDGLLARFQGLEYCMASNLGRKSLRDYATNSGFSVYRRDAFEQAMGRHSLSVYAEDLENSLQLLGAGEGVYYDDRMVVETAAKRTWRGWFSQRVGWAYGLIRVYTGLFGSVRRTARRSRMAAYQYLVYLGGFTLALFPLKLLALVLLALGLANAVDGLLGLDLIADSSLTEPAFFVAAYLKYSALALLSWWLAVPPRERGHLLPAVPLYFFYACAHIVPQAVGYLNWLSVRLGRGRLFRDHYQDEASLRAENGRRDAA